MKGIVACVAAIVLILSLASSAKTQLWSGDYSYNP
jgi:hypothetical protein